MSVYQRDDSPYWWGASKNAPRDKRRFSTGVPVGNTPESFRDSKQKAILIFNEREKKYALVREGLVAAEAPARAVAVPTVAAFMPDFDRQYITPLAANTRKLYRRVTADFVAFAGRVRLNDLRASHLLDWRADRMTRGRERREGRTPRRPAASSINTEMAVLKAFAQAVARAGHVNYSPFDDVRKLHAREPLRQQMTADEETCLLAAFTNDTDRAIFMTATDHAIRITNVLQLGRRDYTGTHLILRETKNGRPHRVNVSARVKKALDALGPRVSDWLFAARCTGKTKDGHVRSFRTAFIAACRRAHISYGQRNGITIHWFTRMTGANRIIDRNGEKGLRLAQQIGNWKTLTTLIAHYQSTSDADMQAAVNSVGGDVRRAKPLKLVRKRA